MTMVEMLEDSFEGTWRAVSPSFYSWAKYVTGKHKEKTLTLNFPSISHTRTF